MRRLIIGCLVMLLGFLFYLPKESPAVAQDNWMYDYPNCRMAAENGTLCSGAYIGSVQLSSMSHLTEMIVGGVEGVTVPVGAYKNFPEYVEKLNRGSALTGVNNLIAKLYENQPASFAYWLDDTAVTLGFKPKTAYAQGFGFSGLAPLLPLWKAFRNVAYLLLAIIIIFVGFMVMFRKKIDPKTVVTVQNALPRIVVTLLLITFSYAIVGILIDLMYLLILLGISVIGGSGLKDLDIGTLQANYLTGGFWQLFGAVFSPLEVFKITGGSGAAGAILAGFLGFKMGGPLGAIIGVILGSMTAGGAAGGLTGQGIGVGAVSALLALILALALLFTFIRIFFILLNAYIQIIVSVILGPLQIMMDALPGSNAFASWFRNLLYNLVTFPIIVILLIIGAALTIQIDSPAFWTPPLIPSGSAQFIRALLGVGIVILIPGIVNGIKEALKIKPALPVGTGALFEPVGATWNTSMQGLSSMYYVSMLRHEFGEGGFFASLLGRGGKAR